MSCDAHVRGLATLADGGALAYQIHGAAHGGPPLLLIRPLGGTMALWGRFRAHLAEQHRVISFDVRGSGPSSPAPAWVTTRALARDAIGLLDQLQVARADVFGISLGGMTATWVASLAPARVGRLCIASAPARGLALTRSGLRRDLAMAACFARSGDEVEPALVHRILSAGFRETHPQEVLRIEALVRAEPASRRELLKLAAAAFFHDARRGLREIHAPTLVLAGQHDAVLGIEPSRALAASIPAARFEIIAGSGHDLTLEQPIVTATRVSRFLRAREDRAGE